MTGSEFIALVRPRIGDENSIVYSDTELLGYLNDAIDQYSAKCIGANDPAMIIEAEIIPGSTVMPNGFDRFAGAYPLYFSGGKFQSLDGSTAAVTVRYFAYKSHIAAAGNLPFDDEALPYLLNYVIVAATARVGGSADIEAQIGGVIEVNLTRGPL